MSTARSKVENIRLLVLDVDGVLTDGRIYYGNNGEELKSFSIKDGLGIKMLQRAGIDVAIITGRQSEIVARRATELSIADVVQGREDKRTALLELCDQRKKDLRGGDGAVREACEFILDAQGSLESSFASYR